MLFQSHGICPICNTAGKLWCKTRDWEYRSTADYYSYLKCPSCHTLFLEQLKENSLLNIYPPDYYSYSPGSTGWLFRLKDRWDTRFYKSILRKVSAPNLSVLDVGGGTGQVLDILKYADKRITYTEVVDIDINARELTEKKGHIYTQSSIETYCTEKKFDVILLLNLIEHVGNPDQLIEKAADMLSDNGVIIVKTPNADSLDARLFKNHYWGGLHCPRHWIIFTKGSFRQMVAEKNLHIHNITFTQGAAFWAYSIINWFRKKDIYLKEKPLIESRFFAPISALFAVFDTCRSFFWPTSQMFIILRKRL